jgi:hypothetical protein
MSNNVIDQIGEDVSAIRVLLVRLGAEIYRNKADSEKAVTRLKEEYESIAIQSLSTSGDDLKVFYVASKVSSLVDEIIREMHSVS